MHNNEIINLLIALEYNVPYVCVKPFLTVANSGETMVSLINISIPKRVFEYSLTTIYWKTFGLHNFQGCLHAFETSSQLNFRGFSTVSGY